MKRFTVLETVVQVLHFQFDKPLDIFDSWSRKWGSSGPAIVYALHCMNGYFHITVMSKLHKRVDAWECINLLEQVIARMIYDSRSGISVIAFHTAPPINRVSYLNTLTRFEPCNRVTVVTGLFVHRNEQSKGGPFIPWTFQSLGPFVPWIVHSQFVMDRFVKQCDRE